MGETIVTDGRASRASKTRIAVVDALLALIDRGNLRPTAREIADEAGVSLRSVYVNFDDVESLFVAAAARNHERMEALRGPWEITGTLDERLASFLGRRRRIYEEGAQVRRAALVQEPFSPVLQRALGLARLAGRAEIERVFAEELAAVAAPGRARLRAELEVVSSSASWETLRQHQGHPPDEAEAMVDELVRAVLRAHDLPVPARDKAPPTASPGPPG